MIMKQFNREWTKPATRRGGVHYYVSLSLPSYLQDAAAKLISEQAKAKLTKQYFPCLSSSVTITSSLLFSFCPENYFFSAQRLLFHISRLTAGLIKPTKYFNIHVCARVYIQCMWHNNFISSTVHILCKAWFFISVCSLYGHLTDETDTNRVLHWWHIFVVQPIS